MTGKSRNLLISFITLAVIIAVFALVRGREKTEEVAEAPPVSDPEVLSDFNVSDLRSVMVKTADNSLQFYSSDGENWMLADVPEYYRLIKNRVITTIRTLSGLQSRNIISENTGDAELTEYGLNPPQATVTLKDREGNTTIVEFGIPSPSGSGRYARNADSGSIVLIPPYTAGHAFESIESFRDMALPVINMEKLAYLEFRHEGTLFRMEPRVEDDDYITMVSPFAVTSPWKSHYALDDHIFQTAITEESALPTRVGEYLDNANPEDEALGLNEMGADMLYLADLDGNILSLVIGNGDGSGNRYIRFANHDDSVFLLKETDLDFIKTDPFYLISKFVFLGSIFQVSQVKVERDNDIWIMTRIERGEPEDTNDDRFMVNNLEVPKKEFTSVYQKFIGLMWEGTADDDVSLKSPEVRITISSVNPDVKTKIIRYWYYDEVYYQVSVGDNPIEFLVGRYQLDDFIDDLSALSEYGS